MANKNGNSGKTAMSLLIAAGKQEAKNVQEIKSVVSQSIIENKDEDKEATSLIPESQVKMPPEKETIVEEQTEKTESTAPKGLEMLFYKREIKDSEAVKIPRELHRELKLLSSMSGVTMMQMIGNLIDNFLLENQKEISSYKRKYINGK